MFLPYSGNATIMFINIIQACLKIMWEMDIE